jgi:hypothetical protein
MDEERGRYSIIPDLTDLRRAQLIWNVELMVSMYERLLGFGLREEGGREEPEPPRADRPSAE